MFSSVAIITSVLLYVFLLVLFIIFVVSHKRIASAQQELIETQKDIAKQLANIAIELRHNKAK